MKLPDFLRRPAPALTVQTGRTDGHPFGAMEGYLPLKSPDCRLYESIREGIPLVDAAIDRIVRLTGGFVLTSEDPRTGEELRRFHREVPVGGGQRGLDAFLDTYLDDLLTYGNAAGEMLPVPGGTGIAGLYNAPLENLRTLPGEEPLTLRYEVRGRGGFAPAPHPELILFTPLRPAPGRLTGQSLLRSLPFVSDILMKIYRSMGSNFDRVANLRYAVTYKPETALDRACAQETAQALAKEWADAMSPSQGAVRDFVAVGDVQVKVIGADNRMLDTEVPVRQMLEQIVAKLGVPPFILGLHWSSTERMSSQQTDILTSELKYYRGLLTPVIRKICRTHLRLCGLPDDFEVEWNNISLQDEVELANARFIRLRGDALEQETAQRKEQANV